MIASILILAFSLLLFLYWFRYTCLLILSAKPAKDFAGQVAAANQLGFLEVQSRLRGAFEPVVLDQLHESLDRDFRLLTDLLRHGAEFQVGGGSLERSMLSIDYKVMKVFYSVTRTMSAPKAVQALEEMSNIVSHFANAMGERATLSSNA